jgi:hypothetical protein
MSDTVHIRLPGRLLSALESAAAARMQSKSEYTRQALLDQLRRAGAAARAEALRPKTIEEKFCGGKK